MNYAASPSETITAKRMMASKRRRRILYVILIGFLAWSVSTFVGQIQNLQEQRKELTQLQTELVSLQRQHEEHQAEITKLDDLEYIEQIARKEYFLSKPGETLFITPKTDE
jgi:cell division protein DivIC